MNVSNFGGFLQYTGKLEQYARILKQELHWADYFSYSDFGPNRILRINMKTVQYPKGQYSEAR